MNTVTLVGNLGKDPDCGSTPNGKSYAKFSLATSRKWKNADGEQQESTEWHNVVCWGFAAEQAEQLSKGNKVVLVGRIQNRKYEKDGQDRYISEVNCFDFGVVPRTDRKDGGNTPPAPRDDIPFAWVGPLFAALAIGQTFIA